MPSGGGNAPVLHFQSNHAKSMKLVNRQVAVANWEAAFQDWHLHRTDETAAAEMAARQVVLESIRNARGRIITKRFHDGV